MSRLLEEYKKTKERIEKLRQERKQEVEKRNKIIAEKRIKNKEEIEKRREERARAREERNNARQGISDDDF